MAEKIDKAALAAALRGLPSADAPSESPAQVQGMSQDESKRAYRDHLGQQKKALPTLKVIMPNGEVIEHHRPEEWKKFQNLHDEIMRSYKE